MANTSTSRLAASFKRPAAAGSAIALLLGAALVTAADGPSKPKFFPDDPLWTDDDRSLSVAKDIKEIEDSNGYDFVLNTFGKPGKREDVRAGNVNSLDEVPDSSWFTNRIGRQQMTAAELVKGPDRYESISLDGWKISGGKSSGLQPGFRMQDPEGHTYQIEVDPPTNPELASGAEIIGTAFYHAFGYNTVDVYLAELDPSKLVISEKATIRDALSRKRRRLERRDINDVLKKSARLPNGHYRVLASRFADGAPLGNFRYYGTRPDDPNDIVLHEHRRELRGARVFGAWLNHDDSRGINSLDMLMDTNGARWIKHYMFDFGSILGSGTVRAQYHRPGNEYIFEWIPGWVTLGTLGFYIRPWALIDYPKVPPSVGRFEGKAFDPEKWKPEYPNPAFHNMRPDDAFWAARIVAKFDDGMIRAIVEKAKYSDPKATDYVTQTLIMRRDKVLKTYLNQVNPLVNASLDASGVLTFENAAVLAKAATPAESYTLQWFRFDNIRNEKSNAGDPITVTDLRASMPAAGLGDSQYVGVTITGKHAQESGWARPATFYFRRGSGGWETVGIDR